MSVAVRRIGELDGCEVKAHMQKVMTSSMALINGIFPDRFSLTPQLKNAELSGYDCKHV